MKPEDVKRSWNGMVAFFTIGLQRGIFHTIQENQMALNDLSVVEEYLKGSFERDALGPMKSVCPECEKKVSGPGIPEVDLAMEK